MMYLYRCYSALSIPTNKNHFGIPERGARDYFSCTAGCIIQHFYELVFNYFAQILCSQMKLGIENRTDVTGDREKKKKKGKKMFSPIKSRSMHSNYTEQRNKILTRITELLKVDVSW